MSCLQLTLICIVLQSNIALIFGAPVSDCKSHTHTIDNKEVKVTSHVNVGLADDHDNSLSARNLLKNHKIQIGDDSSMHINIDISIPPEMFANPAESEKTSPTANPENTENNLRQETLQKTLREPMKKSREAHSLGEIKQDQLNDQNEQPKTEDLSVILGEDVTEGVPKKNEEKSGTEYRNPTDPLVNRKKAEENLGGELKGDSKIEPKSIHEETRQTEDGDEGEGENDQLLEEAELEEEALEEVEESQDMKNDKLKVKREDDGIKEQGQGKKHEIGKVEGDEEEEEDFEDIDDEEE